MDVLFSRFAFIFLIYAVVTSGYINELLSCQMQRFLSESKYFRHLLGVLLVFVFIMMEGGWSWDAEKDALADNDWSSGNVRDSLAIAVGIYGVFLLSSKSRLVPNFIFFGLVLVLYAINTQRNYYRNRDQLSDAANERLLGVSKVILGAAVLTLAYGFVDYVAYQRAEYGAAFRWSTFFVGVSKCSKVVE